MAEVNEVLGSDAASRTQGEFVEVYRGESNPDTTQILVTQLNSKVVRGGYLYEAKVKAKYLNGYTDESPVFSIRACMAPSLAYGVDWSPRLVSTSKV